MLECAGACFFSGKESTSDESKLDKHRFKNLNNARKGYYTDAEYELLCRHLADDVRHPIQTLYITGWRLMEILSRERRYADYRRDLLFLEPGEAKNKEPRIFPFSAELRSILEEQEEATRKLERERGVFIPFLFHHNAEPFAKFYVKRGYWKPTRYFLSVWKKAASAAGLTGRIRHDFRRTAVRRFDCIPDHVGMKLSGHKSSTVYMAYKATNEKDLFDAVRKIESASQPGNHLKAHSKRKT